MRDFLEAFSNREIAIILWFTVILSFIIYKAPKQFFSMLKLLISKTFIPFYVAFIVYFSIVIYTFQKLLIWNSSLYKDFIFWFATSAAVSFFKTSDVNNWRQLKIMIFNVFSWNIIIEFLVDTYNFTLGFEIFFVAVLAFLSMLFVFASNYKERPGYIAVIKVLSVILSASGLALFVYVISQLIIDYHKILNLSGLKSFLFTPIFTLLFSPFIIFTVFYIKYENIFLVLNGYNFLSKRRKNKIKYAIIVYANINFKYIKNAHDIILLRKSNLQENDRIVEFLKDAVKVEVDKSKY